MVLWTRRPFDQGERQALTVEVARDADFRSVVAKARAPVLAAPTGHAACWSAASCRRRPIGTASPTTAAPAAESGARSPPRVNEGAQNAFRRMIWEDERAPADRKLGFVLHLGDFIYEVVEYPDEVSHRYSRTIYDLGRIPDGRKVGNFHVPTNLAGYRHVYRAHTDDPDIQDARAHFPFVCIGDNHEFSW